MILGALDEAPVLVGLVGQLSRTGVGFGFHRGGRHPPSALTDGLVDE
ncbi:hypothetical protein ACFU7T_10960 [Streptomyces sp. NPDC057555]